MTSNSSSHQDLTGSTVSCCNGQDQIEQLELNMAKALSDFRAQAEEAGAGPRVHRRHGHTGQHGSDSMSFPKDFSGC